MSRSGFNILARPTAQRRLGRLSDRRLEQRVFHSVELFWNRKASCYEEFAKAPEDIAGVADLLACLRIMSPESVAKRLDEAKIKSVRDIVEKPEVKLSEFMKAAKVAPGHQMKMRRFLSIYLSDAATPAEEVDVGDDSDDDSEEDSFFFGGSDEDDDDDDDDEEGDEE
mmetsp:Transcript_26469/g.63896  ORF Transcript_26469/g.63896 Transcript_26469/m.63896 type:complete len:168 (-) Transcript_26469:1758-2261(-)